MLVGGVPPLRIDYVWFLRMEGGGLNKCNMQAGGYMLYLFAPPLSPCMIAIWRVGGLHFWGPPGFRQAKGVGIPIYIYIYMIIYHSTDRNRDWKNMRCPPVYNQTWQLEIPELNGGFKAFMNRKMEDFHGHTWLLEGRWRWVKSSK